MAHARGQHISAGGGGQAGEGHQHQGLGGVQAPQADQYPSGQRHEQVFDEQHPHAQARGQAQLAQLQTGPGGHQAQRNRGRANAGGGGQQPIGQGAPHQVERQGADGGHHQGVAQQLFGKLPPTATDHRPHRSDVQNGHADPNQHRDPLQPLGTGQALGQGQANEGVEAKRHLGAARVQATIGAAHAGQVGQAVGHEHAGQAQCHARAHQAGGGSHIQGGAHHGVEQEHGEQEVVNQALHRLPHAAVQGGVAAHHVAAQNEGKVGQQQRGGIHRGGLKLSGFAYVWASAPT